MLTPVPSIVCIRAREAVSARLDGELNELDGARLDQHLRACEECARFAAEAEAVAVELRLAALEPAPVDLFVPHRRRVAVPFAAAAATIVVAVAAGSSFLVGQLVGSRTGHLPAPATTAAIQTGIDPGIVAMLRQGRYGHVQTGRVIAL